MLVYIVTVFLLYFFYHLYWKRRNFPSGPLPLPFLGNSLQLWYYGFEKAIFHFHKTFGDLHTIWFGDTPVVSVNDYPTMVEKFIKNGDAVAGREESTLFLDVTKGGPFGVTFIDGPLWSNQRKFALKVLRDLGMGKDVMQEKVLIEVSALLGEVSESLEKHETEISMQDLIDKAVGSVINSIVFGYRFDKKNASSFYNVKESSIAMFHAYGNPLWKVMENGPRFLQYLPFFKPVFKEMDEASKGMKVFIDAQIEKHREEFNKNPTNDQPRDFVEAFLQQQRKMKEDGNVDEYFSDNQLYGATWDLWSAGQETTSTTLAWIIHYITWHQDVQSKIHKELDETIGSDRLVTTNDKNSLPYLNAVILEVMRHCRFAAINLFHRTLEDIEIHGTKIPKNTTIVNNFATMHRDERYFENPDNFDPSRFIDDSGKFAPKQEMVFFGVGKRACVGEGLAKMELFLFTANIFNQLKLTQVLSKPLTKKGLMGATNVPEAFVVNVQLRW